MTFEEGKNRMFELIEAEIKSRTRWFFGGPTIELSITRILEPYEKTANFPLPETISIDDMLFDKNGITMHTELLSWKDICASGIRTEEIFDGNADEMKYIKKLVLILHSGEIFQYNLVDISKFKGLLGHFIEQYKLENLNINKK